MISVYRYILGKYRSVFVHCEKEVLKFMVANEMTEYSIRTNRSSIEPRDKSDDSGTGHIATFLFL